MPIDAEGIRSTVFLASAIGTAVAIPVGFGVIEIMKWLVSLQENRQSKREEIYDWALAQSGVKIVLETQIANYSVRTYYLGEINDQVFESDSDGDDGDDGDDCESNSDGAGLNRAAPISQNAPADYVTVTIGGRRNWPYLPSHSTIKANETHRQAVLQVRRTLRIG